MPHVAARLARARPAARSPRSVRFAPMLPSGRDVLLAGAAALVGIGALVAEPQNALRGVSRPADVFGALLVLGMALPLAWRRRAPVACLVVPVLCGVAGAALGYATDLSVFFVYFGFISAAAHTNRRTSVGLGLAGALLFGASVVFETDFGGASPTTVMTGVIIGTIPALVGDAMRRQWALTGEVREQAARLDGLRDVEVQRAVAEERVRMARDIHDVVGHHLSAISLQAGAGRVAAHDAATAAGSFESIRGLSSQALEDTRRILGLLREGEAELGPSPGLGELSSLLEASRAAGIEVRAEVHGTPRALAPAVDTGAYRILQEALTNVARHARPARASVCVSYEPDHVTLRVDDDGVPAGPDHGRERPGHGIVGMRERAGLLGGAVQAGPRPTGGWSVRAELPATPAQA